MLVLCVCVGVSICNNNDRNNADNDNCSDEDNRCEFLYIPVYLLYYIHGCVKALHRCP